MNINIKNMVCNRCIMVVGQLFKNAGVADAKVQMGKVSFESEITGEKLSEITQNLNAVGFEIINSHTVQLVEQIKAFAINYVYKNGDKKQNFSTLLSSELNLDYNYLSSIFSGVENITIEHYIINLKVERVKELLVYDEKSLSEIAWELGYSSAAHLSGQFKKVTGFTPSYFKNLGEQKRKSINDI
jgi:AraC-like DNA-binding protein